jgi:hypothetical protein
MALDTLDGSIDIRRPYVDLGMVEHLTQQTLANDIFLPELPT